MLNKASGDSWISKKHAYERYKREYNGEYVQQHEGTAMGNSLSPFIANLFMSKFETEVKNKFEYFPRVWFRCISCALYIEVHSVDILVSLAICFNREYKRSFVTRLGIPGGPAARTSSNCPQQPG
ncbi:hypothetical protein NQ318_023130 [Aromia moschata]|uniref:Reverse transcriptase domain-containing protein n=1 Tax=Aromia moschata TaxID=1265417 RepID=A0AAV8Y476_9CUCU|nr:hypothetical protein NQ318_023130 [Aromia moschata]